jgi:hypothetical protein
MNPGIVNRALLDVGQSPLLPADIAQKNAAYELCAFFYLDTFLEALSEVEWTGGRKRARLAETGRPVLKNLRYRFAYDMPLDCAKPVELQDRGFFEVEGRIIYSDVPEAELLYVSNGKILPPAAAVTPGRPGESPEAEYLSAGRPGTEPEVTLRAGGPGDILPVPLPEDPVSGEDYPGYRARDYEPKFYEYIERKLAARFAMKLSDQPGLHTQMLQEAMLIRQEAVNVSRSLRAAKAAPNVWWTEGM